MADKTTDPAPGSPEMKEIARRQREAANLTLEAQGHHERRHEDVHIDSVATVDTHRGKAPQDKSKSKAMEARKTDLQEVTGAPDVHRTALRTPGKGVTDEVTTDPPEAQPAGGSGGPPDDFVRKAADAANKAKGKGKGKGRRARSSKAKREKAGTA